MGLGRAQASALTVRRQSKDHIPNKREAVTGGALTAVLATLVLVALDHWNDGVSWGAALRSDLFFLVLMLFAMSASLYYWPRWTAKRKRP